MIVGQLLLIVIYNNISQCGESWHDRTSGIRYSRGGSGISITGGMDWWIRIEEERIYKKDLQKQAIILYIVKLRSVQPWKILKKVFHLGQKHILLYKRYSKLHLVCVLNTINGFKNAWIIRSDFETVWRTVETTRECSVVLNQGKKSKVRINLLVALTAIFYDPKVVSLNLTRYFSHIPIK